MSFGPFIGCCLTIGYLAAFGAPRSTSADDITFEKDVRPILDAHCLKCHGGAKRESSFDIRRRFTILKGGDSGAGLVAGQPEKSLFVEMIEDRLMPPDDESPLTDQQIALIREWVAIGAPIKGDFEAPLEDSKDLDQGFDESAHSHWAFQPVRSVVPPRVQNADWISTTIDAFILARLEEKNWQPSKPAHKSVLLRRLYFDLTGLPPTPEETETFVADDSPDAYEQVVDRLLNSPHYGERWAQHWLDVIRFAESEGFEYDRHLPDAWRFRDYVIDSLNADKPFNQFVTEQLAGDELDPEGHELRTATVFHRLGAVRRNAGNPDIALSRNEVLTERTNIVGEAFLGLTIGCARCHNHKLEPITQKDYYRLQAYFAATDEDDVKLAPPELVRAWEKKTESLNKQIKKLKDQSSQSNGAEKEAIDDRIAALREQLPTNLPSIPSIQNDFANRTGIHVLRRGVWEQKGVAVGPRPLSVLVPASQQELPADMDQPRTALARWIVDDENPLTARVIVNRIWQHHFGTGLVSTPNDFGTHGSPPSHPDLLDWLAHQLVKHDWRWKPIHRMIVLSSVYRQSSLGPIAKPQVQIDPENRLLWRFNRRRLSGEEIRDSLLSVAGRLNAKQHGESVMTPVDPELVALLYKPSQWEMTEDLSEHDRRSIYLIAKRNLRLPFMEAFDAPALQTSCPRRETSTHAPQALELLNGEFANEMAAALANRLNQECHGDREQMVHRAFRLALGRPPTHREFELSKEFLSNQPVSEFALAIFNLNGFSYVD